MAQAKAPQPDGANRASAQAAELAAAFDQQIERAFDMRLQVEPASLAIADHHLQSLREEDREPIISLVAVAAGAWFGELVRSHIGASWIGDGRDPRKLRLLLEPALIHFSPIDLAYEAIFGGEVDPEDPRAPQGAVLDGSYTLDGRPNPPAAGHENDEQHDPTSDRDWIMARLDELSPVDTDTYYSLTGRFETLELILSLLAHRRVAEGKGPRAFAIDDYLEALARH